MTKNMTNHAQVDRYARLAYIIDTVGLGEIIAEIPNEDYRGGFKRLTSTGVVIVVSKDARTIVTAYIAKLSQAEKIYRTSRNGQILSQNMARRIINNEKYRVNQPC